MIRSIFNPAPGNPAAGFPSSRNDYWENKGTIRFSRGFSSSIARRKTDSRLDGNANLT